MQFISSPDNRFIKLASSLKVRKYREATGMFLVEGWRSVNEVLVRPELIEMIMVTADRGKEVDISMLPGDKTMELEPKLLKQVCATDNPQGIAAIVRKPSWSWGQVTAAGGLLIYLDRISDPGNLGSILRSCLALGVKGVLMSPGCVDLYNLKVVRATMGAILNLPVLQDVGKEEVAALREAGYAIACTDADGGQRYYDVDLKAPTLVILGSEGHGVGDELKELSGARINIPVEPAVDSLNVAAACAIIIAEARRQRQESMERQGI
ncbi:MAG: RNA methyltransferase [Syntrophomonadaceae bacterium]